MVEMLKGGLWRRQLATAEAGTRKSLRSWRASEDKRTRRFKGREALYTCTVATPYARSRNRTKRICPSIRWRSGRAGGTATMVCLTLDCLQLLAAICPLEANCSIAVVFNLSGFIEAARTVGDKRTAFPCQVSSVLIGRCRWFYGRAHSCRLFRVKLDCTAA
jgi:hypothetical protein